MQDVSLNNHQCTKYPSYSQTPNMECESELDMYEADPESHTESESHTKPESEPDQSFIENQQGLPNYQYGIYMSSPLPVNAHANCTSSPPPVDAHVNCMSGPPPADAHVNCNKLIDEGVFFSLKEGFQSWVFH